jgi:predicted deacylase
MLNIEFIWVHDSATVLQSTLAHSLNTQNTPTLVVEMGIGMRITREYGDQLIEGILNMMCKMEMWTGPILSEFSHPEVSTNGEVCFLNADASGIILPNVSHSVNVKKGDLLCKIVDSLEGKVLQEINSPVDGLVFTLRTYPVVYEGSLVARIFSNKTN